MNTPIWIKPDTWGQAGIAELSAFLIGMGVAIIFTADRKHRTLALGLLILGNMLMGFRRYLV